MVSEADVEEFCAVHCWTRRRERMAGMPRGVGLMWRGFGGFDVPRGLEDVGYGCQVLRPCLYTGIKTEWVLEGRSHRV
jgi:hypothetical protein